MRPDTTGTNESAFSAESHATPAATSEILLNDGFEGSPWDQHFTVTGWQRSTSQVHSGSNSAYSNRSNKGCLTTDDLNATISEGITIDFWFRLQLINAGDICVEAFNGVSWDTLWYLRAYPTFEDGQWCRFTETLTDPKYFKSNFKLRFNSSGFSSLLGSVYIDDSSFISKTGNSPRPPRQPDGCLRRYGKSPGLG